MESTQWKQRGIGEKKTLDKHIYRWKKCWQESSIKNNLRGSVSYAIIDGWNWK